MPAGSESRPPGTLSLPHTWRPLGVRLSGTVFGGVLVLVSAVSWWSWPAEVRAQFTGFQRVTILLFAVAAFAAWYALVRSRVVAHADRLVVVNGFRRREFAWAQVIAAHLGRGAPWARIDLADGTTTAAMGIQASDGTRARAAMRQLRAVIDSRP
ncbi:MAG: PH domain-containing protein [Nocardioides sp.]